MSELLTKNGWEHMKYPAAYVDPQRDLSAGFWKKWGENRFIVRKKEFGWHCVSAFRLQTRYYSTPEHALLAYQFKEPK